MAGAETDGRSTGRKTLLLKSVSIPLKCKGGMIIKRKEKLSDNKLLMNYSPRGFHVLKKKKDGDWALLDNVNPGNFGMSVEKPNGAFYFSLFDTDIHFYHWRNQQSPNTWIFHELLLGDGYRKPYFDLDIKGDHQLGKLVFNNFMDCVLPLLPNDINMNRIMNLTSHGLDKQSFHILFTEYHCTRDSCLGLYERVIEAMDPLYSEYLDGSIYSKNNFRMLGSHKRGDPDRVLVISPFEYKDKVYEYQEPTTEETVMDIIELKPEVIEMNRVLSSMVTSVRNTDEKYRLEFPSLRKNKTSNIKTVILTQDQEDNIRSIIEKNKKLKCFKLEFNNSGYHQLKRICPGKCIIHKRVHDSISNYIYVNNNKIYIGCYNWCEVKDTKLGLKRHLHIGDLDISESTEVVDDKWSFNTEDINDTSEKVQKKIDSDTEQDVSAVTDLRSLYLDKYNNITTLTKNDGECSCPTKSGGKCKSKKVIDDPDLPIKDTCIFHIKYPLRQLIEQEDMKSNNYKLMLETIEPKDTIYTQKIDTPCPWVDEKGKKCIRNNVYTITGLCKLHSKKQLNSLLERDRPKKQTIIQTSYSHIEFNDLSDDYKIGDFNVDVKAKSSFMFDTYIQLCEWVIPLMSKVIRVYEGGSKTTIIKNTQVSKFDEVCISVSRLVRDSSLTLLCAEFINPHFDVYKLLCRDPRFTLTKLVHKPYHILSSGLKYEIPDISENKVLPGEFNMFSGIKGRMVCDNWEEFEREYLPEIYSGHFDIDNPKVLDHIIHIWCRDDLKTVKFVLSWLCCVFKYLGMIKTRSFLVVRSELKQCAYKSLIFGGMICEGIYGKGSSHTQDKGWGPLSSRFAKELIGCLFYYGDELPEGKGNSDLSDNVKGPIVNPTITIEVKGGDNKTYDNRIAFAGASNNKFTVAEVERFALVDSSSELYNKPLYRQTAVSSWLTEDIINIFYTFFVLYPYETIDLYDYDNFPTNDLTKLRDEVFKNSVDHWLEEIFNHERLVEYKTPDGVYHKAFYDHDDQYYSVPMKIFGDDYKQHTTQYQIGPANFKDQLSKKYNILIDNVRKGYNKRTRVYLVPKELFIEDIEE
jgi:hypothetical protein